MTALRRLAVAAAVAGLAAACSSGSGNKCSLEGGTTLPAPGSSSWPKFQADGGNTGRAAVDLSANVGTAVLLFAKHCSSSTSVTCATDADCADLTPSEQTCVGPLGPVLSTPILGPLDVDLPCAPGVQSIFVGSADGNVYVYCEDQETTGEVADLAAQMSAVGSIVGSPAVGADGALWVSTFSGALSQYVANGGLKNSLLLNGGISASPNLWENGVVYLGTETGDFSGVCPNAVPKFTVLLPPYPSTAAVVGYPPDVSQPVIVVGANAGQVQAYDVKGRQFWSFRTAANIEAAILIDDGTDAACAGSTGFPACMYVADTAGNIFATNLTNGQLYSGFVFAPQPAPGAIAASMALGSDAAAVPTLYVASQASAGQTGAAQKGVLYAVDRATGAVRWSFEADGPISASPAVATGGDQDIVVLAADVVMADLGPVGGYVYAIRDDGDQGTVLWKVALGATSELPLGYSIGTSSPALGQDGSVYIGRGGNRLGTPEECGQSSQPCLVNDGGALYVIK